MTGMGAVTPDEGSVARFLELYGRDAIHLASLAAEGGAPECKFFGGDARGAAAWAASQNERGRNIYWTVNGVRPGLNRKPTKADINTVRFAHVDIDPPKNGGQWDKAGCLLDLELAEPRPHLIVDSGGGAQAYWKIGAGASHGEIEAINKGLALRFGGDNCWNVDRLMRVPGTTNYPGTKKRAAGRQVSTAQVVAVLDHGPYAASELQATYADKISVERGAPALPAVAGTLPGLDLRPGDPLLNLIMSPRGVDRSADTFAAACEMVGRAFDDEAIRAVLLDPALPISAHCLDQSDSQRAARRAISKARLEVPHATGSPAPATVRATPYPWPDPAAIPRREWLYGQQLLRGSVALVVAPGGMGKTALTVGIALALASGRAILGKEIRGEPCTVWLWNLEDPRDELHRTIAAAALHHDLQAGDVGGRLFVDSGLTGAGLCTAVQTRAGHQILEPVYEALVAEIIARNIDVLIVDPFVSSHAVPENDNGAIDAVAKAWARVAAATNCAIILVHHTAKSGGAEITAERARGAGALVNAARSVLALNRMSDDEANKLGVREADRRRLFRAYDDKNNRAPPAENSDWYRLESVVLPNGDGDECFGDSVGVVVPWTPPALSNDLLDADKVAALQALIAAGEWRENERAELWAGKAAAEIFGLDVHEKAERGQIKIILKQCIRNGWLTTARRPDKHREERTWIVVGHPVPLAEGPTETPADDPHDSELPQCRTDAAVELRQYGSRRAAVSPPLGGTAAAALLEETGRADGRA